MDERRMQRLVGMVVIFTFTFFAFLLVINTNNPAMWLFRSHGYVIEMQVDNAPGVSINTPVRKDGVLIGRVSNFEWNDQGVLLSLRIDQEDVLLYPQDKAQIEPSSIFGDAVIKFTRQPHPPGAQPLLAGTKIEGTALPDPLSGLTQMQQNLSPSIEKLGVAGDRVALLADKVSAIIGEDPDSQRIQTMLDELTLTLRDFRRTTNNIDSLFSDQNLRAELQQALHDAPEVMKSAKDLMQRAEQTLASFDTVVASAGENLRNIEGLTKPLGENGEEIANLILTSVENLDIVLADFSRFAKKLNNSQGTLGRLIDDPKMADQVSRLLNNANVLVWNVNERVRVDLEPIMNDLRVFVDKIARNPGAFLNGAINPTVTK